MKRKLKQKTKRFSAFITIANDNVLILVYRLQRFHHSRCLPLISEHTVTQAYCRFIKLEQQKYE